MKLVLGEMLPGEICSVDSLIIPADGRFTFRPYLREQGFWILRSPERKMMVMLLKPGDEAVISGDRQNFPRHLRLKCNAEAILFQRFQELTWQNEFRADSLENALIEQQDSVGFYSLALKADTLLHQIREQEKQTARDFIRAHPSSLASLLVLNYMFGTSPLFTPEEYQPLYHSLDSALYPKFAGNTHVEYHHQRIHAKQPGPSDAGKHKQ